MKSITRNIVLLGLVGVLAGCETSDVEQVSTAPDHGLAPEHSWEDLEHKRAEVERRLDQAERLLR